MKTSTTLHECDNCASKRLDDLDVPEGWQEGLLRDQTLCPACVEKVYDALRTRKNCCLTASVVLGALEPGR